MGGEALMGLVLEFYRGAVVHPKGFTLDYVLSWHDSVLESEHHYIQWLFPLTEPSQAARSSPVLVQEEIAEFTSNAELRLKLLRAFQRMLAFYGFSLEIPAFGGGRPKVVPTVDFLIRSGEWLTPGNHNYRRITRILKSLATLGLQPEAAAFLEALAAVYRDNRKIIGDGAWRFWTEAVRGQG
jgi:hypothetical protein